MPSHDYSTFGYYFVTICTKDREIFFGNIKNNKIILNGMGHIAYNCWMKIPNHYDNIILHEFVIMPNHIHGIVEIVDVDNIVFVVGNRHACSLQQIRSIEKSKRPYELLPIVIGSFKSAVTKYINRLSIDKKQGRPPFGWQKSYHDSIIRSGASYRNIVQYIRNNPTNWDNDRNNTLK